eukprot:2974646-Amphidinium_carterae.1
MPAEAHSGLVVCRSWGHCPILTLQWNAHFPSAHVSMQKATQKAGTAVFKFASLSFVIVSALLNNASPASLRTQELGGCIPRCFQKQKGLIMRGRPSRARSEQMTCSWLTS